MQIKAFIQFLFFDVKLPRKMAILSQVRKLNSVNQFSKKNETIFAGGLISENPSYR